MDALTLKKEQAWQRKLAAMQKELLFKIVGEICLKAAHRRDFGHFLKRVLETGTKDEPIIRDFLREKGVI